MNYYGVVVGMVGGIIFSSVQVRESIRGYHVVR